MAVDAVADKNLSNENDESSTEYSNKYKANDLNWISNFNNIKKKYTAAFTKAILYMKPVVVKKNKDVS